VNHVNTVLFYFVLVFMCLKHLFLSALIEIDKYVDALC
jgi:hypothetical protein